LRLVSDPYAAREGRGGHSRRTQKIKVRLYCVLCFCCLLLGLDPRFLHVDVRDRQDPKIVGYAVFIL
jgi:hypothetical protein